MTFHTRLDHVVIAASSLDEGERYVRETLNVDIPPGGRHDMMGTWNRVMRLGEGVYLEVIAVNPDMPAPAHPRWFALDDPRLRRELRDGPRLLTWAVNTDSLEQLAAASVLPLGEIHEARRDNLRWKVALSRDGGMPAAGFVPLCIQWLVDFHPSARMADLGVQFLSLDFHHPRPGWLADSLDAIGARDLVNIHEAPDHAPARMELALSTASGTVVLSSQPD